MRDGVEFNVGAISSQPIREAADYQGVRVSVPARIGGARLTLRLDLSFGDPVQAQVLAYPTLLDDPEVTLLGYPVEAVIAEKVESMIFLGDAVTKRSRSGPGCRRFARRASGHGRRSATAPGCPTCPSRSPTLLTS